MSTIDGLHRRYSGVIFNSCLRILGDRAEAEDAVQETFVAVVRANARFSGVDHLPWLRRIALNVCRQVLRSRRRKAPLLLDFVECPDSAPSPARSAAMRLAVAKVAETVDDRDAEILNAMFTKNMTQAEAAVHVGLSRRSVVKRLALLRTKCAGVFDEPDWDDG